jgi:hypothetical protein
MDFSSTETFPQIVIAVVTALAIFFMMIAIETLYKSYLGYGKARIAVLPMTASSTKSIVVRQDPKQSTSKTLVFSENQLTGIEFSYSTFLYISDDTIGDTAGWRTVFYKGYESRPFPLQGPGVFVSGTVNQDNDNVGPVLRVVMNSYDKWFNKVDVNNIPFNKWFHLAIVLRKNNLEVYVNGNMANRLSFAGTLPYQNYQSLNIFPTVTTSSTEFQSTSSESKRGIPVNDSFVVLGKASGYISNLFYFSYALTYSEIQGLLAMGPSNQFSSENMDRPPYLIDSWWTSRQTS